MAIKRMKPEQATEVLDESLNHGIDTVEQAAQRPDTEQERDSNGVPRSFGVPREQLNTKPKAPPKEKTTRFREQAVSRVKKAKDRIARCAKIANTANYKYSETQAKWVVDQLQEAVNVVKAAFNGSKPVDDTLTLPE